jgi:hypothetical protein
MNQIVITLLIFLNRGVKVKSEQIINSFLKIADNEIFEKLSYNVEGWLNDHPEPSEDKPDWFEDERNRINEIEGALTEIIGVLKETKKYITSV